MDIQLRGRDIEMGPEYRDYVEQKIDAALGRFAGSIAWVRVGVTDENGTHGAVDKACRVEVRGEQAWEVLVTARDRDPYNVVHQAGDRASIAVGRAIGRNRARSTR